MRSYCLLIIGLLICSPAFADRYAVLDEQGKCINIIEWDGKTRWAPSEGQTAVKNDSVHIPQEHIEPKSPEVETLRLDIEQLEQRVTEIESKNVT